MEGKRLFTCTSKYLPLLSGGFAKTKKNFFRTVRKIPYVRNQIQAEIDKTAKSLQLGFAKDLKPGMSFLKQLPAHGSSAVSWPDVGQIAAQCCPIFN